MGDRPAAPPGLVASSGVALGEASIGLAAWNIRSLGTTSFVKSRRKPGVVDKLCRAYSATAVLEAKASEPHMHKFARRWAKTHKLFTSCTESDRNIGIMLLVQKDLVCEPRQAVLDFACGWARGLVIYQPP